MSITNSEIVTEESFKCKVVDNESVKKLFDAAEHLEKMKEEIATANDQLKKIKEEIKATREKGEEVEEKEDSPKTLADESKVGRLDDIKLKADARASLIAEVRDSLSVWDLQREALFIVIEYLQIMRPQHHKSSEYFNNFVHLKHALQVHMTLDSKKMHLKWDVLGETGDELEEVD
jgi:hypothetical protein